MEQETSSTSAVSWSQHVGILLTKAERMTAVAKATLVTMFASTAYDILFMQDAGAKVKKTYLFFFHLWQCSFTYVISTSQQISIIKYN
jgi:hypothetical protein